MKFVGVKPEILTAYEPSCVFSLQTSLKNKDDYSLYNATGFSNYTGMILDDNNYIREVQSDYLVKTMKGVLKDLGIRYKDFSLYDKNGSSNFIERCDFCSMDFGQEFIAFYSRLVVDGVISNNTLRVYSNLINCPNHYVLKLGNRYFVSTVMLCNVDINMVDNHTLYIEIHNPFLGSPPISEDSKCKFKLDTLTGEPTIISISSDFTIKDLRDVTANDRRFVELIKVFDDWLTTRVKEYIGTVKYTKLLML